MNILPWKSVNENVDTVVGHCFNTTIIKNSGKCKPKSKRRCNICRNDIFVFRSVKKSKVVDIWFVQ